MTAKTRPLNDLMSRYTRRSGTVALGLLFIDIFLLGAWTWAAVSSEPVLLKLLFALLAGDRISALFVIGHDAAHGAYTDHKWLNQAIGRIAFLPSLHNYSLWQIAHNRKHHRYPNLKGLNSWSPMSYAEYQALSPGKRLLQRIYRTPLGLGPYYIFNRWLPEKFYPGHRVADKISAGFRVDFAILIAFLAVWLSMLAYAGRVLPNTTSWEAILWGWLIPFLTWNYMMGIAIYLQHTNKRVPWFATKDEWRRFVSDQHEITCHVTFPGWYNIMTHNIMQHTAHHLHPRIPFYQLHKAEKALADALGERFVSDRFTIPWFLRTMRDCKLYDYEQHKWLDFRGNARSGSHLHALPLSRQDTGESLIA